jgi:hypothetical protein
MWTCEAGNTQLSFNIRFWASVMLQVFGNNRHFLGYYTTYKVTSSYYVETDSGTESWNTVTVSCVASVSEKASVSIFWVKVSRMRKCLGYICRHSLFLEVKRSYSTIWASRNFQEQTLIKVLFPEPSHETEANSTWYCNCPRMIKCPSAHNAQCCLTMYSGRSDIGMDPYVVFRNRIGQQ